MELTTITQTYLDLKAAKARRKDLKAQLKEEVIRHPAYSNAEDELLKVKEKMRLITIESLANSQLEPDINDVAHEIKELQAVLDDLVVNAIALGAVKYGQEINIDGLVLAARVRVNLKQMSMDL